MTSISDILVDDTSATVMAVQQFPPTVGRVVARDLYRWIVKAEGDLLRLPAAPHPRVDALVRRKLIEAVKLRKTALKAGASHHRDPKWAAAALIESWTYAWSGKLEQDAAQEIHSYLTDFMRSALPVDDMLEPNPGEKEWFVTRTLRRWFG
jgi:hypothetical protein